MTRDRRITVQPYNLIQIYDVVQITPEKPGYFRGCFMVVTEVKTWGVQGFVAVPRREGIPLQAYYRAEWSDIEHIGASAWAPKERTKDDDKET